jgi:hypothetical protein
MTVPSEHATTPTADDVIVRIDLPLPLDIAAGLMSLAGAHWPSTTVASSDANPTQLVMRISGADRDAAAIAADAADNAGSEGYEDEVH